MRRHEFVAQLLGVLALGIVAVAAGCGNGRLVLPVRVDPSATMSSGVHGRAFPSYDSAVRGLAAIFVRDLHLPVPPDVTVFVYGSRDVFERGLVEDGRVSEARAAELGEFALGVGRHRQLLLNAAGMSIGSLDWTRLVAHELAHVSQIELAMGEGRAAQWLAEGMAEWVAFSALERLGLDTIARRRVGAYRGIRTNAALLAARLDLEALGSPRGFTVRHRRDGAAPTYQLAFLMADYLIARGGFDRVVAYFRSFAESRDGEANFRNAFGQTVEQFEAEILAHLQSLLP